MTVTLTNVDKQSMDLLKAFVKIKNTIGLKIEGESDNLNTQNHIEQINSVCKNLSDEEQTFTCNASKAAIWEVIKDDTW